jgi:putative endonuclease
MYILFSEKLNKYYIGACIDIERRLYEHNIGHSKFTALGVPWVLQYTEPVPWVLQYTEPFETLQEAKKREQYIKKMKSRKYIDSLIAKGRASRF